MQKSVFDNRTIFNSRVGDAFALMLLSPPTIQTRKNTNRTKTKGRREQTPHVQKEKTFCSSHLFNDQLGISVLHSHPQKQKNASAASPKLITTHTITTTIISQVNAVLFSHTDFFFLCLCFCTRQTQLHRLNSKKPSQNHWKLHGDTEDLYKHNVSPSKLWILLPSSRYLALKKGSPVYQPSTLTFTPKDNFPN